MWLFYQAIWQFGVGVVKAEEGTCHLSKQGPWTPVAVPLRLLESRPTLEANDTWALLRSSPDDVAAHLGRWMVALAFCLLPTVLYCFMCFQACGLAARRRGYCCGNAFKTLPPRSRSFIEGRFFIVLLMAVCAFGVVMTLFLVDSAHLLANARCRSVDGLRTLVQGGGGPSWQGGFSKLASELAPLGAEALVAANGTASALVGTAPFASNFAAQLNKTLQTQQLFAQNVLWHEHRCLFCEEAAKVLEGYAISLMEGPPGLLERIRDAAALSATEAGDIARVADDLRATVARLGKWLIAAEEDVRAWPFPGSQEVLVWLPVICGGTLAAVLVIVLAAAAVRYWLFSKYESVQEALGGVNNEVAQDNKFLSSGGQEKKAKVVWDTRPAPLEGFGSLLLIQSSNALWLMAGGMSVAVAIAGSLCSAAGVLCRDMLTSHSLGFGTPNLTGLSAILWAEASSVLSTDNEALDVLWTCLRDSRDLRVFDTYWPFAFADRLSVQNLTLVAEGHAISVNELSALASEARLTRGLSGSNFIHEDTSEMMPPELRTSSAANATVVPNNTVIPGMWEYLEVLNRMTGDTPHWSFSSLDGRWLGCPTELSPCRWITEDEPTEPQILQMYGSATYAETFRIARMKERVWNRVILEGSTWTLQTWAAKSMSELDQGHERLVESLGFGVARQTTVESIHGLWGDAVKRVERAQRTAGDCSWFAKDLQQSTEDGKKAAELLVVAGIASCCVALGLSILACTAHSLWRRARHRSDNQALEQVLKRRALGGFADTPKPAKPAPKVAEEASKSNKRSCRCFQRRSQTEAGPPAPPTPFGGKDPNAVVPFHKD